MSFGFPVVRTSDYSDFLSRLQSVFKLIQETAILLVLLSSVWWWWCRSQVARYLFWILYQGWLLHRIFGIFSQELLGNIILIAACRPIYGCKLGHISLQAATRIFSGSSNLTSLSDNIPSCPRHSLAQNSLRDMPVPLSHAQMGASCFLCYSSLLVIQSRVGGSATHTDCPF